MTKCKNCGHELSIDKKYNTIRHRVFSNFVFPHYDCTENCQKGCGCTTPEPETIEAIQNA